ncbi:MAG: hypothetical protein OSB67_02150 [Alphaproteobacteria bacterium]|jgi:hypothetical protein|nr:hypothetical protein [Alphaproteobacteria bacterium]
MNDTFNTQAWLIGGAGRSGKTTLANSLQAHSRTISGFPLEGVFHVYLQRRFPFFRYQRLRLLTEYMNRPRYVDALRTRVERPRDHLEIDADTLAEDLPDSIDNPIGLFAWLLDRYAVNQGKKGWAVFDLLPELRYTAYRKLVPGVKLVVMQRSPEEAVTEALFWRAYPETPKDRRRRLQNLLFQWCLSRKVTEQHRLRYPKDVVVFSVNALTRGDPSELSRMAYTFDMDIDAVRGAFDFKLPFSYHATEGFRGPDGVMHKLLSEEELKGIANAVAGKFSRWDLTLLLSLAPRAPVLVRGLGDFLLYPGTIVRRRLNGSRQRVADAAAGIRLRLRAQS